MSESLKVEKLGIIFVSDGSLIKLCSLSCSSLEVNPQIKNYQKFFLNFLIKCSLPMSVPKNKIKKIGHRARSSPKGHCNSLSGPWLKNITVFLRALYSPDNEFFLKRNTRCAVLHWGIILGVTGLESSPFYNILIAFFVLLFFFNPFKGAGSSGPPPP